MKDLNYKNLIVLRIVLIIEDVIDTLLIFIC